MKFQIRFTPEAEETYLSVVSQLRARWGEKIATKFENKVSNFFDLVSIEPEIYPVDKQFVNLRRCVIHKNCSVFYKVNNDHILIVYFWDNRQEPLIHS